MGFQKLYASCNQEVWLKIQLAALLMRKKSREGRRRKKNIYTSRQTKCLARVPSAGPPTSCERK